jgi:DNA-binding NtrC family response regulator
VFAHAMHARSARRRRPFVAVNCAALSEELVSSELFGHERGAFHRRPSAPAGELELADGGTVFLDEIGEMSPTMQTKLLRVLEDRASQVTDKNLAAGYYSRSPPRSRGCPRCRYHRWSRRASLAPRSRAG